MIYLVIVFVIIGSYLIGSINSSIIISRMISGKDIRESGSGNAGATNMLRTHGKKAGVITLLIDVLKGILAISLTRLAVHFMIGDDAILKMIFSFLSGLLVVIGHNFPIFFGFKGGKGVATGLGVILMLDWQVGVIVLLIALAIMAITKYVSLGSVVAAGLFVIFEIIAQLIRGNFNLPSILCAAAIGGLIIIRHRANIKRLCQGTESKLGSKK